MTTKDFQILIINILSHKKEILHIFESNDSLLVTCNDESSFFVNILESKHTFIHDESDAEFINQYMETHSEEEFARDILNMAATRPGFFFYFTAFSKLEEMEIIDSGLLYHIMDSIIYYEREFDEFIIKTLWQYGIGDNECE